MSSTTNGTMTDDRWTKKDLAKMGLTEAWVNAAVKALNITPTYLRLVKKGGLRPALNATYTAADVKRMQEWKDARQEEVRKQRQEHADNIRKKNAGPMNLRTSTLDRILVVLERLEKRLDALEGLPTQLLDQERPNYTQVPYIP